MIEWEYITRLMKCFPRSFINQYGEFIAHRESNAVCPPIPTALVRSNLPELCTVKNDAARGESA